MRLSGTQCLVCLCVRIWVPRGVQRDLMLRSRMGRKSRISRDPSHPSSSQQLHLTIEWRVQEKSLLLYFIVKNAGFFSPAYPHQGKGSHSQCVRGCNLQGKRTMWKMEVQNGKQTKLPVLFPSNSMSNVNYSAYACLTLISRMLLLPLGVTVGFWNSSNLGSSTYSRSYWSVEKPSNTKVIFVATGGWTLRPFREGVIQSIFRLSSSWLQV